MYEHRRQPLLPQAKFLFRMASHGVFALAIVAGSLLIGVIGYHFLGGLTWIDSLLNSAMLLGGMGPVNNLQSNAAKIFASFYALFAGLVFLVVVGVLFAPLFHRFLHRFHLEFEDNSGLD